jgi:hypothetical protein
MFLCNAFARLNDNSTCVETGEIRVSTTKLFTSFVYSCSVLTFQYINESDNNIYNFMAHVDAFGEQMEKRLLDKMRKLPLNTVPQYNIYYGPLCKGSCKAHCRCKSMNIIKNVFAELGLKNIKIKEYNLEVWQTEVSIPEDGDKNNKLASDVDRIFPDNVEGAFKSMEQFIDH